MASVRLPRLLPLQRYDSFLYAEVPLADLSVRLCDRRVDLFHIVWSPLPVFALLSVLSECLNMIEKVVQPLRSASCLQECGLFLMIKNQLKISSGSTQSSLSDIWLLCRHFTSILSCSVCRRPGPGPDPLLWSDGPPAVRLTQLTLPPLAALLARLRYFQPRFSGALRLAEELEFGNRNGE